MSSEANNFVNLMHVVQSYMNEKGEKALTKVEKYLNLAIEGYSQINLWEMNTIDTARLDLDVNTMTARLPPDFLEMIKLGIEIRGKLYTLTVNNNLVKPEPLTICDAPIESVNVEDPPAGGFYFAPYWYNGYYYSALFGVGGGFNCAYYRIDYNTNTVIFSGFTGAYPIILEYKSSGVKAGGALIPRTAIPALKAYIHFASIRHDGRYSDSQINEAERRYNVELYSLQRLNNSFSYAELCDTLYSTYSQSIKR
jgi:hypothetical protein